MRSALLPGMTNVVRFPVERRARATLELMRDLAPDVREVLLIADAFYLDGPLPDLRAQVDAETAQYIFDQFSGTDAVARGALESLLDPVVVRAVAACRAAHDVSADLAEAQGVLQRAQTAGHVWLDPLRERVEALALRLAGLLLEAHARVEEAEGVARAVGLARRGEPWAPRDHQAEDDALLAMAPARLTG